ncbi:MAG: hypothetical protein JSR86_02385 [Proteobacteria bacterium]|nr:hypothetical protein [Pseudomonadota bacterium]
MSGYFWAFITSVIAAIAANEAKSWLPWMHGKLLRLAVSALPVHMKDRYAEEWSSFVAEIPGDIGKLISVFGFVWFSVGVKIERAAERFGTLANASVRLARASLGIVYYTALHTVSNVRRRVDFLPRVKGLRRNGLRPPKIFMENGLIDVVAISIQSRFSEARRAATISELEIFGRWLKDLEAVIQEKIADGADSGAAIDSSELNMRLRDRDWD